MKLYALILLPLGFLVSCGMTQSEFSSKASNARIQSSQITIEKEGYIERKSFLALTGLNGEAGKLKVGEVFGGKLSLKEEWLQRDGSVIEAHGFSPVDLEDSGCSIELIDQILSGAMVDSVKFTDVRVR
ncbi:hypothetical protein Rhal01_00660 [Rubritalea halochordaticola]|uniref:Lipoprotein n=1 Tax=Rubritalea halochordaticola TaxID=714537 RepID=A0ABP9UXU5_9BACT